jgi:hypothetical protein
MPHDDLFIEVFCDGVHAGTAFAAGRLSPEQRQELLVTRREQYVQARHLMSEAARLRQHRYDDAVADGEAQLPPLSAQPGTDRRGADAAALLALQHDEQDKLGEQEQAGPDLLAEDVEDGIATLLALGDDDADTSEPTTSPYPEAS